MTWLPTVALLMQAPATPAPTTTPAPVPPEIANWKDPGYNRIAWAPSPNFNARPEGTVIDTIVLHHTANSSLTGVVRWFANPESRVSAHFTVGKDGSIAYHVSTWDRAWHAGPSRDRTGRTNLNNNTVGIEIVNVGDGKDPWTEPQVKAVANLCAFLIRHRYPEITTIVSHEYIATPPGRKPDPRNYPWETLRFLNVPLIFGRADQPAPPGSDR